MDASEPTVVITHGWGDTITNPYFCATASTLYAQNHNANILGWDWTSQAAITLPNGQVVSGQTGCLQDIYQEGLNGVDRCLQSGYSQGILLAHELQALDIKDNSLQLIGHSAGAAVVGEAASVLSSSGQKVERVTTLDAPDLKLKEVSDALPPGSQLLLVGNSNLLNTSANALQYVNPATSSQVENYYSGQAQVAGISGRAAGGFGAPILSGSSCPANVFNGQIYPGMTDMFSLPAQTIDHLRIPAWYGTDSFGAGVNWSVLSLQSSGFKSGNYCEQGLSSHTFASATPSSPVNPSLFLAVKSTDDFTDGTSWSGQDTSLVDVGNGNYAAKIGTGTDGFLYKNVLIPRDASYMTFDLEVCAVSADDFFTVTLGSELLYYRPLNVADSEFLTVDPIYIGNFAGQNQTLLFTVNHVGSDSPSVLVDNVTFSGQPTPEPSSLILLLAGIAILATFLKLRKKS